MPAEPLMVAVILAHQGGWDEILLVLTPIVVIVLILRLVKRRIDAQEHPDTGPTDTGPTAADPITGPTAADPTDDTADPTDDGIRRR